MNKITLSQKLWIFCAACVLAVAALAWQFYTVKYATYRDESAQLDQDLDTKKGKLRQILAQKQRIKDLEAEIDQANQEFAKLQEMFPDEEVIPKRLIDLTAVTRKSLAVPTKFQPLRVEEKEFYRENHYSITISSNYHSLGMLFGEVANFKYPTAISKLSIDKSADLDKEIEDAKEHGDTPKTIVASFELTTFTSKK